MGVFGDYALKYLEQGYVVFPVIGKGGHGKTPYEWNKLTAKIVNDGKFNKGFLITNVPLLSISIFTAQVFPTSIDSAEPNGNRHASKSSLILVMAIPTA